jgi:hypothetical protein
MIRSRVHIIPLLLFCFYSAGIAAQSRAKSAVDRTTILVGEPIIFKIEATVPATSNVKWFAIDTIPHFEIVTKGPLDSVMESTFKTYRQQLTITSYDSGYWSIPSYTLQAAKLKLKTDTIPINVTYSPADPNQPYHDIKEIIPVEKPANYLLYWILGAITLLFAVGAYFYLRKKKPVKPVEEKVSKLSPYEEAMQSLDELSKQRPLNQPAIKDHFTRLNDILRVYLKRRFNYSTLEKTNEELILQLRKSKLQGEAFTRLAQALRMNDFIKFAKYLPSEGEKNEVFNEIKQSIKLLEELNKPA